MPSLSSLQSGPSSLRILILGKEFRVPEDKLIWIFQDLGMIRFSNRFCWNGECLNCPVRFKRPGEKEEVTERACQTLAVEGMEITEMPLTFYKIEKNAMG